MLLLKFVEKETLVKLARKLDSIQSDLDSCRSFIEAERIGLREFKEQFGHISKKRVGFSKDSKVDGKSDYAAGASNSATASSNIHSHEFANLRHLSQEEFASIPKYSRGRIPLDKINSLIDHLNRILHEKYTLLLRTNPAKLGIDQRQRVSEWRAAETAETASKFFVTEADLKVKSAAGGPFKFDQVARNVLTILRLVGRIKESRNAGIIRYIFQ